MFFSYASHLDVSVEKWKWGKQFPQQLLHQFAFMAVTTFAIRYLFSLILTFLSTYKLIILAELTVSVKTFHRSKSRNNNSLLLSFVAINKTDSIYKANVIYFSFIGDSQNSMCVKWIIVDYGRTLILRKWKVKVVNSWKS